MSKKDDNYTDFFRLSEHSIGIILKELIRRSMLAIRKRRFGFNVYDKTLDSGKKDIFTDADIEAEKVILKSLKECFPDFDIISEEDNVKEYCKSNNNIWITVDPLCGTKNFSNRSSIGIATTISMVIKHKIVSTYVGNVMTQEIFGYRPLSEKVHRISEFETFEEIRPKVKELKEQPLLIRGTFKKFPDNAKPLVHALANDVFESYLIDSGSLSLSATKLWTGEVGAILIQPRTETPWDLTPILGICQKLGFVYLKLPEMTQWEPPIVKKTFTRDFPVIIIHNDCVDSLNESLETPF